jgi:hypothetical protein
MTVEQDNSKRSSGYKTADLSVYFCFMPLLSLLSANFHSRQSPLKGMDKATQRPLNPDSPSYYPLSGIWHPASPHLQIFKSTN